MNTRALHIAGCLAVLPALLLPALLTAAPLTTAPLAPSSLPHSESFSLRQLGEAMAVGLVNANCLRYCITGSCTRLNCRGGFCEPHVVPLIRHRLPDLIVSSWNQSGHPWKELRQPMRLLAKGAGLSSGAAPVTGPAGVRRAEFREADVIANPLNAVPLPGLCRAVTRPWQPYYSSLADSALWRSGLTELLEPASWVPTAWPLISGGRRFGSLFPRKGFSHHNTAADGAMTYALRALDIAEQGGLHLRLPIIAHSGPNGAQRLAPGRTRRLADACWQQIHPHLNPYCHSAAPPLPVSAPAYAWQVWTTYECCLPGPGTVIHILPLSPQCF